MSLASEMYMKLDYFCNHIIDNLKIDGLGEL